MANKKLVLKTGDNVIIYFDHYQVPVTVKGFYCYGMHVTKLGVVPFKAYSFYGAGYSCGQRFITVTKKWHYKFAVMAEWIRLNLFYYAK